MMTYFEVFSLPFKLALDPIALEKQFYSLSRKLHPDPLCRKTASGAGGGTGEVVAAE